MWYKNIAGRFLGLVTKHACDGQTDRRTDGWTDRITTPKTALSIARVVKTKARFIHLLQHPAWKWSGPILISALHKFVTYLLT